MQRRKTKWTKCSLVLHQLPTSLTIILWKLPAIDRVVRKFGSKFNLHDRVVLVRQKKTRIVENITAVQASIAKNDKASVVRRSQKLGPSPKTTWWILWLDMGLHSYKMVLAQEFKLTGRRICRKFSNLALKMIEADSEIHRKINFSDEAHFYFNVDFGMEESSVLFFF